MKRREALIQEQNMLLSQHAHARSLLLGYKGVVGVGVGVKERGGKYTDELCYRVYVREKAHALDVGVDGLLPREVLGMGVDVVRMPRSRPASAHPATASCPDFEYGNMASYAPNRESYRAVRPGIRINRGFVNGSAGTLGAIVKMVDSGAYAMLSCRHVFEERGGKVGSRVGQPKLSNCGVNGVGTVIKLGSGDLDCGIACLDSWIGVTNAYPGYRKKIVGLKAGTGTSLVTVCDKVYKCGAASDWTSGRVVDVAYLGVANNMLIAPETGVVLNNRADPISLFCLGGDSGSMIVMDKGDKEEEFEVVGLLHMIAGDNDELGVAHHINPVLSELNISLDVTEGVVGFQVKGSGGRHRSEAPADRLDGAMAKLLPRLAGASGTGWHSFWEQHEDEILGLVNQNRAVKLAWHKGQGPAFVALALRAGRDAIFVPPKEVHGVTIQGLMLRMAAALCDQGSPGLQRSIQTFLERILTMEGATV